MAFRWSSLFVVSAFLLLPLPPLIGIAGGASNSPDPIQINDSEIQSAPVEVDGIDLFQVRGVSALPAKERARIIASRIAEAAADPTVSRESLSIEEGKDRSLILAGEKPIVAVYEEDALLEGLRDHQTLATALKMRIAQALQDWRHDHDPEVLQVRALYAFGSTVGFILFLWVGYWAYRRLQRLFQERLDARVKDIGIQSFKIIRREQFLQMGSRLVLLIWGGIVIALTYVWLHWTLSLFPWTRSAANALSEVIFTPLLLLAHTLRYAIPKLIFLAFLFFITAYLLKLIRLFFTKVEQGAVTLGHFAPDWAMPTYRLVRLLLILFALVVAYPYIPGSDTAAFKGISIFVGVLFSLGSTSFISNLIAGYTMFYRRAFRVGDRVLIGEHLGDVEETNLLVTYLRTPKNEQVVIPNSVILNNEVVNYSTLAQEGGLILHTTVGIGYETPWRQVEAMLKDAAARTPGLLKRPPPFVLQKELGDFCVTYEINVYCSDPQAMYGLYTELHRSILDVFNEYGVQIMTPAYERDPPEAKVVPKENWYLAPAPPPGEEGNPKEG